MKDQLPEFYELQDVFENSSWHHETTFDHTLMVMQEYENFLTNYSLSFLNDKIENNSKKELLKLAILLHDIAKKETIVIDVSNNTTFLDHERLGGIKAGGLLKRFDISDNEKDHVVSVISNHDRSYVVVDGKGDYDKKLENLKSEMKDIYPEIIIITMMDVLASKLKERNVEKFNYIIGKYKEILGL